MCTADDDGDARKKGKIVDGLDLMKLWQEIDPQQSYNGANELGIAELFKCMIEERGGMHIRFYCAAHRKLFNDNQRAPPGEARDAWERRVWIDQGLHITQQQADACRVEDVLRVRTRYQLLIDFQRQLKARQAALERFVQQNGSLAAKAKAPAGMGATVAQIAPPKSPAELELDAAFQVCNEAFRIC